jgi:Peptidase A4 family
MFRIALRGAFATAGLALSFASVGAAAPLPQPVSFAPIQAAENGLSNWGGYIAQGSSGEFITASADWTVPAVTCLANRNLYAPWVGIDGDGDDTVEQTGVATSCGSGAPVESAWYELYPNAPVYYSNPISAGDAIVASVTSKSVAGGTKFRLTISDTTQGWNQTVNRTPSESPSRLSAEAVIESPNASYPQIPAVTFTNVLFNSQGLSTFSPIKSATGDKGVVYRAGSITHGDDFTISPNK